MCAAPRRWAPAPRVLTRRYASAMRSWRQATRSGPTAQTSSSSCARARSVPRADEQSLRPWLARLAASGRLVEIAGEVDPAAGLAAQLIAHRSEPVRIARVRGSALPVVANLLAGRSLIADALGVAEPELGRRLTRAIDAPLEPRVVADGPCQALAEEHPDLAQLPIPQWFEHEGGPYITAGCIVARDPETGERNWSIARVRPLGGARALVGIAPNPHLAVAARAVRTRRAPADRRDGRQSSGAARCGLPLPRARRGRVARRGRAAGRACRARALPPRPTRGARRLRARAGGRARPRGDRRGGRRIGVP